MKPLLRESRCVYAGRPTRRYITSAGWAALLYVAGLLVVALGVWIASR